MTTRRRIGRVRAGVACLATLTACSVTVGSAPSSVTTRDPSVATSSPPPASSPAASPSPASSDPSPAGNPETCTTPLSSYPIRSDRTGAVTAADERVVVASLRLARSHFDVRVPGCDRGAVAVTVLDQGNERFAAGTFVHGAPRFEIEVYAGGGAWTRMPRSQLSILMLHEWYHVVQASYLRCPPPGCREQDRPVPAWLIEGSAEYAAAQAAQDERLIFYSFIRRAELARAAQVETPLERLDEARTSADYGLSFAAVEFLVEGAGSRALLRFWEEAGATGRWQPAFARAFGTSTGRFYRAFAAYRARGFRR